MENIFIPETYNYIAAFLTFACQYRCSYCINSFEGDSPNSKIISGDEWIQALNRIESRPDLPITLQGGEPSMHPDFIKIINGIKPELAIDILTNLAFDLDNFIAQVDPARVKRDAPYASIRVSYHPEVMDCDETIMKVLKMRDAGFSIGIWGVLHPATKDAVLYAQAKAQNAGIDFRTKEFLGECDGVLYGTYKYEGSCGKTLQKDCECKTTELIIGPSGDVYRCHADLYNQRAPVGNILDKDFTIEDIYRPCSCFGHCNPCDVKVKTNRFQEFGHTSVDIKFN